MLVTGTNVLYISFMIMFCFIKILMTDTSYEKSDGYIINSILIGFILLTFIETIVIFIVGNNIQITSIIFLILGLTCWIWYISNSALLNDYSIKKYKRFAIIGSVFLFGFLIETIVFLSQHIVITFN